MSYPGGKDGRGIYQTLINQIPPHDVYIAPFAGFDAIARRKKPARRTVLIDRNRDTLNKWLEYLADESCGLSCGVELIHGCGVAWIRQYFGLDRLLPKPPAPRDTAAECGDGAGMDTRFCGGILDRPPHDLPATAAGFGGVGPDLDAESCGCVRISPQNPATLERPSRDLSSTDAESSGVGPVFWPEFVYLDPPYPLSTRTKKDIYGDYELTDDQHRHLLDTALALPCYCMISCYPNEMYDDCLSDWSSFTYQTMTRGGLRDETCWMNYPEPASLHDSRYVGEGKRERERIRRRASNKVNELGRMDTRERQAVLDMIAEEFGR